MRFVLPTDGAEDGHAQTERRRDRGVGCRPVVRDSSHFASGRLADEKEKPRSSANDFSAREERLFSRSRDPTVRERPDCTRRSVPSLPGLLLNVRGSPGAGGEPARLTAQQNAALTALADPGRSCPVIRRRRPIPTRIGTSNRRSPT